MQSLLAQHLAVWKKRRDIARINDHLLWLKENREFVQLQIPRYESELRRLQAQLFLMEPTRVSPQALAPERPPALVEAGRLLGAACRQVATQVLARARLDARPASQPAMRRSGLPSRSLDTTWR